MITLKNIQIEKSIATKRLQYSKNWTVYLDQILFAFALLFGFVVCPILMYKFELDLSNTNERFIGYVVLPILIFYAVYMTFRTFTQFRLKKIVSNQTSELNRQLILDFAKAKEYKIRVKNNNCIILDQPKMVEKYARTAVLLFQDEVVYYTFLQDDFKLNTPTCISHLIFAWELKKWIKKEGNQKSHSTEEMN